MSANSISSNPSPVDDGDTAQQIINQQLCDYILQEEATQIHLQDEIAKKKAELAKDIEVSQQASMRKLRNSSNRI